MHRIHLRAARCAPAAVLLVLFFVPSAGAAVGDTVNVRIEGQNATLLARRTITLQPGTVPTNAGCPMTTIGGAIETATGGNWDRQTFTSTILGESHTFTDSDYWSGWLNNQVSGGFCSTELSQGDDVLITYTQSDPVTFAPTVVPLELGLPSVIDKGSAVAVHATEYASADGNVGTGTATPANGIVLASAGAASATTGADGNATLAFPAAGTFTVQGTRGAERSVPVTVCVHDGNDGSCGTTRPGEPAPPPPPPPPAPTPVSAGATTGLAQNQVFTATKAPRRLGGSFDTGSTGLRAVELRLIRRYKGACQYYSVLDERFKGTRRCTPGAYYRYKIGDQADWSYLLPAKLRAGSYTLEVTATDKNGLRATQTRKFTVK
jgi:hypothetical protein